MDTANVLVACTAAWNVSDLSRCKPLGLDVSTWLAVATASTGIAIFILRRLLRRWRADQSNGSRVSRSFTRSRFRNLCRAIKPLMDENYRIFSHFGPNSGHGDGLPKNVRFDLGVWEQSRHKLDNNNSLIRGLIIENRTSIPVSHRATFDQWLDHIDAFHAHALDPGIDYREHQFPANVSAVVSRFA